MVPNQLLESFEKLKHWQAFFSFTNPIYFYVPFTLIGAAVLIFMFIRSPDGEERVLLRKAAVFVTIAVLISVVMITQINLKIYFGDLEKYRNDLYSLSVLWLLVNLIRLYLVASAFFYTFKVYLLRQTQGKA